MYTIIYISLITRNKYKANFTDNGFSELKEDKRFLILDVKKGEK